MDIRANGIRFHAVEFYDSQCSDAESMHQTPSNQEKKLLLFIHGFSQNWRLFQHQLKFFSSLGYRAVAVDIRGYGASDQPPKGYDIWSFIEDVKGMIRALGYENAFLIVHGSSGIAAWMFSLMHPAMVLGLVVYACPHPLAIRSSIIHGKNNRLLYDLLLGHIPYFSVTQLQRNDASVIADRFYRYSCHKWHSCADFSEMQSYFAKSFLIPKVARFALKRRNWIFRNFFLYQRTNIRQILAQPVDIPVLLLYGEKDILVSITSVTLSKQWAPQAIVSPVDAGHFGYLENFEQVNQFIEKFISEN